MYQLVNIPQDMGDAKSFILSIESACNSTSECCRVKDVPKHFNLPLEAEG